MVGLVGLTCFSTIAGCRNADADDTAPQRKVVEFKGKPDPLYAGTWMSHDHSSTLDLRSDGSVIITAVTSGPSGKSSSKIDGDWAVSDKDLLLRYSTKSDPTIVIKYAAELNGKTLSLTQAGNKHKTVYEKK